MISGIVARMIEYANGNVHDVQHFIKVWGYAKTIGELEGLDACDQLVLEAAAVTHDIACPLLRQRYGSAPGHLQEKEGPALATALLQHSGLSEEQIRRVACLVGCHHTYGALGQEHQILVEADYLVNAEENGYPPENLRNACGQIFRTQTGIRLLKAIFSLEK